MRKIYTLGICLLVLLLPFFGNVCEAVEASGKTQTDIAFIQGDKLKDTSHNTEIKEKIIGLFPQTGEKQALYLIVIGLCIFALILIRLRLKNKNTRKKEQE